MRRLPERTIAHSAALDFPCALVSQAFFCARFQARARGGCRASVWHKKKETPGPSELGPDISPFHERIQAPPSCRERGGQSTENFVPGSIARVTTPESMQDAKKMPGPNDEWDRTLSGHVNIPEVCQNKSRRARARHDTAAGALSTRIFCEHWAVGLPCPFGP